MSDILQTARDLAPLIRSHADEAEASRRLPDALIEQLRAAKLFQVLMPKSLGGLELALAEALAVIEEVAAADGSTGWCVLKGATTNMLAAYLPSASAAAIWRDPTIITGGSFNPVGRAEPAPGGYRLTGRLTWGTGLWHAAWALCGALVYQPGATIPTHDSDGLPRVIAAFVPAEQVELIDTWDTHGMRGTGSVDFAVTDVFVPTERTLAGMGARPVERGPLYAVPFQFQAAVPHAAVAFGIARAALAGFVELAASKTPLMSPSLLRERESAQRRVGEALALIEAARAYVFDTVERAWADAAAGGPPTAAMNPGLSLAAVHATQSCLRAVDLLYGAAGGSAVFSVSPLQRQWRDLHVAASHALVSEERYAAAGRARLGGTR